MPSGLRLRSLELFRTVMMTGSVSAAARLLQLSQPGASKALRHFEDQLGFRLFERSGGRLVPTPEAAQLHQETERVFHGVEVVERLAHDMRLAQAGVVTLACTPSLAYTLVARAVARFRTLRPRTRVWIDVTTARDALAQVGARTVDLALVYTEADTPLVRSEILFGSALVCVAPRGHALAKRPAVGPRDLAEVPVIANVRNAYLAGALEAAFREAGVPWEVSVGVNHTNAACALVREGAGIALTEPWALDVFFPDLVQLPFQPTIGLAPRVAWSAMGPISRTAQAFLGEVRTAARATS
jgi:DNA-binding transcriptional LysR family regulator